jgi:mRNA interferase RelE/StbE
LKRYRLKVSDDIVTFIRTLHPKIKKKIRSALKLIITEPYSGKSLQNDLKGLMSFKVSRFRIIYKISSDNVIELVAVGHRSIIYEEIYKLIMQI